MTPDNRLAAIARAEHASAAGPQSWLLRNYVESRFGEDSVTSQRVAQQALHTAAGADFLRLVNTDPSELALRTLYRAIRYLRANNLDTGQYEIAFWSRVARTLGILVALLFALPFGFGSLRSASLSARTTSAWRSASSTCFCSGWSRAAPRCSTSIRCCWRGCRPACWGWSRR